MIVFSMHLDLFDIWRLFDSTKRLFYSISTKKLLEIIVICEEMRIFAGNLLTKRHKKSPVVLCG